MPARPWWFVAATADPEFQIVAAIAPDDSGPVEYSRDGVLARAVSPLM